MSARLLEQVAALEDILSNGPDYGHMDAHHLPEALQQAQAIISELEGSPNFPFLLGLPRWIQITSVLQRIAYLDADNGGERDVAAWCERQWATILQEYPLNVPALQGTNIVRCRRWPPTDSRVGMGHAWLLKSQQMLAKIHSSEGSLSSPESSSSIRHRGVRWHRLSQTSEEEWAARIDSPNYVQARDLLRPALEAFDRAIGAADTQGAMTGELLQLVSRAHHLREHSS